MINPKNIGNHITLFDPVFSKTFSFRIDPGFLDLFI